MGSSPRPGRGRRNTVTPLSRALTVFLAGSVLAAAPVWASQSDTLPILNQPSITFEEAQQAYKDGDKTLALYRAELAAKNGDPEAQVMAGYMLRRGEGGAINLDKAVDWYQLAAAQNHPDAYVALGEMALREQGGLTPDAAEPWLRKAINMGRTDAMRVLADMYYKGKGVPQDPETAKKWLLKASADGDVLSAREMGDQLLETHPKDALQWYEKAAAKGDPQAAYVAAIMYAENFEIRPDAKKAAILMRQAAEAGIAAAQADYGLLVYQGSGVERSETKAAKWFQRAAKGGDKEGQFLYAFTLAKGEGVDQSFEHAYYWLLRSGETGVDAYNQDRLALRESLEENVDPEILARARVRYERIQALEAANR